MKKLTIIFVLSMLMSSMVFTVAAAPSLGVAQIVPKAKSVSKKTYRKGHWVTVTTWRHGKRITKKVWRKGYGIGRKTVIKTRSIVVGPKVRRP